MSLVHNWYSQYSKIKQILVIASDVDCIIMHTEWTGYLMLRSNMSIHESGREHIALGGAISSLIVQCILQLVNLYLILNSPVIGHFYN
jgi:hypothetical protein